MKRSRWRKTIAAVCLICCFVIGAGAGAQQDKTDQSVQDDADSAGKMLTAQGRCLPHREVPIREWGY